MGRITAIDIPAVDGLVAGRMSRLGRVVVLAGPNGAGKSRVLGVVNGERDSDEVRKLLRSNVVSCAVQFEREPNDLHRSWYEGHLQRSVARTNIDCEGLFPRTLFYELQSHAPDNPERSTPADIRDGAFGVRTPGSEGASRAAVAWLKDVQERNFSATHPDSEMVDEERVAAKKSYATLKEMIRTLLGKTLGRDRDGRVTLGGEANLHPLSLGERVLLRLAVSLHAQDRKLSDLVILLDEPENHLHPKALLDVVLRLSEQAAQVWIATHSVPLIGSLVARHPECLWYVDGGRVSYAGRTPDVVLSGLVGDDDERDRLRDFLGLPAVLAANRFAAECLLPPGVADTPAGDPQLRQIREALAPRGEGQRLRVLDYGAGKARLARELAESNIPVDYVACDESPDHADEARAAIEVTGGGDWVPGLDALDAVCARAGFDVVVLCNVLHEVPPAKWPALLRRLGGHLRDEGVLLLVEDQRVPVGEKAHKDGFVVLDSAQVRTLFDVKIDGRFWLEAQDGRLKAHFLGKAAVCSVTPERVKMALAEHRERALDEVARLRDGAPTYKNGQLHAFWSMQFTNVSLVLGPG